MKMLFNENGRLSGEKIKELGERYLEYDFSVVDYSGEFCKVLLMTHEEITEYAKMFAKHCNINVDTQDDKKCLELFKASTSHHVQELRQKGVRNDNNLC